MGNDMAEQSATNPGREFLKVYWAIEKAHEDWSRNLEASHGLTAKQYALLQALRRQSDMTTSDLTALIGKAQPAITQMLNRLEDHGFIRRETNARDRRRREVRLTPKAEALLTRVEPVGPTRAALGLESANDREGAEVLRAISTLHHWMTRRKFTA